MRNSLSTTILLPLCAIALGLGGCPAGGKQAGSGNKPDQATAQSSTSAQAGSEGAAAQAGSGESQIETPTAPPAEKILGMRLFGAVLGMSPEDFMALFPAGGEYEAKIKWMSPGDVGIGNVRPVKSRDESRDASFAGGILINYSTTEVLDDAKYKKITDVLTAQYGTPSDRPPDFAAGNDFFKDFAKDRANFAKVMFWSDPVNHTLISATQWPAKDRMYFLLFNPEAYDSLHKRKMKTPPGQQAPPPPGQQAPAPK